MELSRDQLRQLAAEAYGRACSATDAEERGVYAGIESLARYLSSGKADGRLDRLLSWTGWKH